MDCHSSRWFAPNPKDNLWICVFNLGTNPVISKFSTVRSPSLIALYYHHYHTYHDTFIPCPYCWNSLLTDLQCSFLLLCSYILHTARVFKDGINSHHSQLITFYRLLFVIQNNSLTLPLAYKALHDHGPPTLYDLFPEH